MLQLMTAQDVAEVIQMTAHAVYGMVKENRIPFVRVGSRCIRFRPEEIEHWILNNGAGQL